jgi:hypothetical protein
MSIAFRMRRDMLCFQNALAYFAMVVSYACKMFMKATPGVNVITLFSSPLSKGINKLECLSLASPRQVWQLILDGAVLERYSSMVGSGLTG